MTLSDILYILKQSIIQLCGSIFNTFSRHFDYSVDRKFIAEVWVIIYFQDSSKYSNWFEQFYGLYALDSFSDLQFPQSVSRAFEDRSKDYYCYWYHRHLQVPLLFFSQTIVASLVSVIGSDSCWELNVFLKEVPVV